MNLMRFFHKAFTGGKWIVGLRNKETDNSFTSVPILKGQWLADPFLYEYEGHHYLFVEQYFEKYNRAGIGVFEIINGKAINNITIIDNPYHMSYPCVFDYKGCHWMIPESSSNQTLDLYKADSFPSKWSHVTTIIQGRRVVDTTVYVRNDTVFLITYEKVSSGWALLVYLLDMETFVIEKVSEIEYKKNTGRPAGNIFEKDGRLYRPAQNCSEKYGESILIYEITQMTESAYQEKLAKEINKNDILFDAKIDRIHTYNQDTKYETVDAFQEQFSMFRWFKIIKRQYFNK